MSSTQTHIITGALRLSSHDVEKIFYSGFNAVVALTSGWAASNSPSLPLSWSLSLPLSLPFFPVSLLSLHFLPLLHFFFFFISLLLFSSCPLCVCVRTTASVSAIRTLWTHIVCGWATPKRKGLLLPQVNHFALLLSDSHWVPQSQTFVLEQEHGHFRCPCCKAKHLWIMKQRWDMRGNGQGTFSNGFLTRSSVFNVLKCFESMLKKCCIREYS